MCPVPHSLGLIGDDDLSKVTLTTTAEPHHRLIQQMDVSHLCDVRKVNNWGHSSL